MEQAAESLVEMFATLTTVVGRTALTRLIVICLGRAEDRIAERRRAAH